MSVRDIALAAHRDAEARAKATRDTRERLRREEEAEQDRATLAWVGDPQRSVLARWFPQATWVLVDRKFPQTTAVVHPEGEPDLLLIVTEGHDYASVPSNSRPSVFLGWLVDSRIVRDVEQLGHLLADRIAAAAIAELVADDE